MLTRLAMSLAPGALSRGRVDFTRVLRRPQKILCLPSQDDGELLLALPAIRSLRRHYRDSLISLLVVEEKRGLWRFDDEVDEVIEFRPEMMRGITSQEYRRLLTVLSQRHFDLAIDLSLRPRPLWNYLLYRSRPQIFGGPACPQVDKYRNLRIRDVDLPDDEVYRCLRLLRPLGINYEGHAGLWPRLADAEGRREFRERLRVEGLKRHQPILVVDGAVWEPRQLSSFLENCAGSPSLAVVVLGGAGLGQRKNVMVLESPSPAEAAEALSCAQGYIGIKNDRFSLAYMLRVPSLIVVPENSHGLPAPGPSLKIVFNKKAIFPMEAAVKLAEQIGAPLSI